MTVGRKNLDDIYLNVLEILATLWMTNRGFPLNDNLV